MSKLDHGFKEITFPAVDHAVLSSFPFSNTLSIFIGVARVYPKLAEYIHVNKLCAHPMIEIYDNNNIFFMAPLSRYVKISSFIQVIPFSNYLKYDKIEQTR